MNAMGNTIRRCEKCNKVVRSKSGFYISIYSRKTYKNGEHGFLCSKCYEKLERWFKRK